jgi:hypothetical protein
MRLLGDELTELEREYVVWGSQNYVEPHEPPRAISMVNRMVRDWGHTFIYDEETLHETMAAAGFARIERHQVNQSPDAFLTGIDIADKHPEAYLNLISVVLEAVKPG